jgi:hypothetical protein
VTLETQVVMRWERRKAPCLRDNAMRAHAAYEAFNDCDFDRAAALVAEELKWVNVATGETFRGPKA